MCRWLVNRFVLALAFVSLPLLAPHAASGQTLDDLFNPDSVQEVRLFINSRDLTALHSRYLENTYYTADLEWRGMRVRNAAVRSRGTGSRNPTKLGLRVDFDRYTSGQTLLGLHSLILDNNWQDPSFVAERTSMSFFQRLGEAAPRESYARVYINNAYQGLYSIVESVDASFISRAFDDPRGFLFRLDYQSPWRGEYLGDDFAPYKAFLEPETHKLDADATLYGPIRELFREANADDDPVWRERVEQYIRLPQLMRYIAIETFLSEDDGFIGAYGMNNFYLYRAEGSSVHGLIPWDKDTSFLDRARSIFARTDENVLVRRALAYPDLRAAYLDMLETCARSAASDDWLAAEIDRLAALAAGPVADDTLKQYSTDDFTATIERLRSFAAVRSGLVLQEVAAARAAARE